jgi:hypothetical protein
MDYDASGSGPPMLPIEVEETGSLDNPGSPEELMRTE